MFNFYLLIVLFLFNSCQTNETKDSIKLEANFNPAFTESSEIIFEENGSPRLKFFIKKNLFEEENSDTFYFKEIALSPEEHTRFKTDILSRFNNKIQQKESLILDGFRIRYLYIKGKDSTSFMFHSPNPETDSLAHLLTVRLVDRCKSLFMDTIIKGYLNELSISLGGINSNDLTPFKLLREKKYPGQIKYSR